ncbi:MAG: PorT family protein [Bacteroidia bacterium]|nr:PorT family protein [Bacteroidia bacterium]
MRFPKSILPRLLRHLAVLGLLFWLSQGAGTLFAQVDCSGRLNDARNDYQAGKLIDVIEKLSPCLKNKSSYTTSQERIQALRLVALAHLFRDEDVSAKHWMEEIFKENPLYEIDPEAESEEYVALFNSFLVQPRISLGINLGLTNPIFVVSRRYTVGNELNPTANYGLTQGFIGGVQSDIYLAKRLYFSPGISVSNRKIRINDQAFDFTQLTYQESQTLIHAPVAMKYEFARRQFIPFIKAGISADLIVRARADLERTFPGTPTPPLTTELVVKKQRNLANLTPWAALGAGYRIGTGKLEVQVGFRPSFNNLTRAANRYAYDDLMFKFYYVQDDLIIHHLDIQIAYSQTFYRIIPVKSKR